MADFTHIQWFVDEFDNTVDYSPLILTEPPTDPNIVPFPEEPAGLQEAMYAGWVTPDFQTRTFTIDLEGARVNANNRIDQRWRALANGDRLLRDLSEQIVWISNQTFRMLTAAQFNALPEVQRGLRFPYLRKIVLKYGLANTHAGYSTALAGNEADLVDEMDSSAELTVDALAARRNISLATSISAIEAEADTFMSENPLP